MGVNSCLTLANPSLFKTKKKIDYAKRVECFHFFTLSLQMFVVLLRTSFSVNKNIASLCFYDHNGYFFDESYSEDS
jgi:hypothetical protein